MCALVKGGQPAGCWLLLALSGPASGFTVKAQMFDVWRFLHMEATSLEVLCWAEGWAVLKVFAFIFFEIWGTFSLVKCGFFFYIYPQGYIHKIYLMVWRVVGCAKPFISANSTSSVLCDTSTTIWLLPVQTDFAAQSLVLGSYLVTVANGHMSRDTSYDGICTHLC